MNVISCHSSMLLNSYHSHSHNCWELVYQLSGETKTVVGDKSLTVSPGDVWIMPPQTLHKGVSSEGFRDFSVKIADAGVNVFVLIKDESGDILTLLQILERVMTERGTGYAAIADGIYEVISAMVKSALDSPNESKAVRTMKDILYENISNSDFRLADAVEKTGFDRDYFRRMFKRETSKNPLEYLIDLRITRAKQLLERQADITVGDVAKSVGFDSGLYFSTCFKKKVGISPTEYRNRCGFNG